MRLKDIPTEERPRERLKKEGADKLSNEELLAIVLKTGTKNKSVKEISLEILKEIKGLINLDNISIQKLQEIEGIGEVKAITLLATIELGRRIFLTINGNNNIKLNSSKMIWEYTKYLFHGKKQECFYALYFNNKQQLISKKLLFMGTLNRSIVHPREVFKEAYICSASNIVCLHNHPSGDVSPSEEDIIFTDSIFYIGKIQGIPVIDHIIVSDNCFYSFYEKRIIRDEE